MIVPRLLFSAWLPILLSTAHADPAWLAPSDLQGGALGYRDTTFPDPPEAFTLGMEIAEVPLEPAPDSRPDWFLRLEYATPSENTLSEIIGGEIVLLSNNESYCLTLGRYLKRDLFGLPLDLSLNGSVCFHPSNSQQEDIFQYRLWFQLHWTEFPWNDHLRTRFAIGEGLSYVEHIPYSEFVRRDGRNSAHFLNYIEFSISFNLADLLNLTRLNDIVPGGNSPVLDNAWLVGSLHHRSGGWGLFGTYEDEFGNDVDVTGGDNLFALGVMVEY